MPGGFLFDLEQVRLRHHWGGSRELQPVRDQALSPSLLHYLIAQLDTQARRSVGGAASAGLNRQEALFDAGFSPAKKGRRWQEN